MKQFILAMLLASTTAVAEPRIYAEYKNDFTMLGEHYADNSSRNNMRLGLQGKVFYAEMGPVEQDGAFGTGYEAGYKVKAFCDQVEFKGKVEGYQFDSFEGTAATKIETEVRYYFN